ncbi:anthranilate phosphoribosyltransferase [Paenisporosarcina quisquiliarum]|uniref:Anthranilate phosphoribosyltransferase n=1 Tax=Paenisporosarcina quisquiliarum TaxID=365346 RepID=A0A9X3LHE7_9BACL|nr:anthranilate phosphoribosyltransferase [Paenisporosarcina quisquiliarum]MCZ8537747.1 anthranilate phosphoribosyltransferase [Paenisporosarcina quisquiliarum]
MRRFTESVRGGNSLTYSEMREATNAMFSEETAGVDIANFLNALSIKSETTEEIAALVEVLRENATQIPVTSPFVFDNCGTGGDGSQSFNISTTSSFVLAGAGLKIAKHGNRSISSRTGSADVLEELGIALDFLPREVDELLNQTNIAFLFAPHVHPKMKRIQSIRKSIGKPTIFNMIGPLTNPVELTSQLVGVYRPDKLMDIAAALHRLGRKSAIVLSGAGGMDEASLAGDNHLVLMKDGDCIPFTLNAQEVGLPYASLEAIRGGDAKENAAILTSVLRGEASPYLDTVLLNAGIGLFAAGTVSTIQEGVHKARKTISNGRAFSVMKSVIAYSQNRNYLEVNA